VPNHANRNAREHEEEKTADHTENNLQRDRFRIDAAPIIGGCADGG
jgi:hypothetical protein